MNSSRARRTLDRLERAPSGYRILRQRALVSEALIQAERARDALAVGDSSTAAESLLAAGIAYGQSWTLASESTVLLRGQDVGRTGALSRKENRKLPEPEVLAAEYYDLLDAGNSNPYKVLADRHKAGESAVRKALTKVLE